MNNSNYNINKYNCYKLYITISCSSRYADTVVHRMLAAALAEVPPPVDSKVVERICNNCNERKTLAKKVQVQPLVICVLVFFLYLRVLVVCVCVLPCLGVFFPCGLCKLRRGRG